MTAIGTIIEFNVNEIKMDELNIQKERELRAGYKDAAVGQLHSVRALVPLRVANDEQLPPRHVRLAGVAATSPTSTTLAWCSATSLRTRAHSWCRSRGRGSVCRHKLARKTWRGPHSICGCVLLLYNISGRFGSDDGRKMLFKVNIHSCSTIQLTVTVKLVHR